MRLSSLALASLPLIHSAYASSVHFKGHRKGGSWGVGSVGATSASQGTTTLTTSKDIIYMASVTIGGTEYTVQLDTGSSDLWVKPPSPVPNAQLTQLQVTLKYGIGSAVGVVGTAPVSFAGFDIPKQAFLSVSDSDNPIFQFGAVGILGLGFTSLSQVDATVNATGADWGRSLLYNTFVQYPQEPNFIAFNLQRSDDPNVATEGSFTIGEIEPGYESVMSSTAISTYPPNSPTRWTVLFEGYSIGSGSKKTLKSSVPDAPQDLGVILLDTGTSYIYAPTAMVNDIYSPISGASFDSSQGVWFVPCNAEVDITFYIGGTAFPLHPLDVIDDAGDGSGQCIGTFLPQTLDVGTAEFDILAGDAFLRNTYAVYDFGDFADGTTTMGNPYVKLMSTTNAANASAEFHAVRGGSGSANLGTGSATSPTSSSTPLSIEDVYNKLKDAIKYASIGLAVLGVGALLLGCLCGAALVAFLNRRKHRGEVGSRAAALPTTRAGANTDSSAFLTATTTRGSYAPVSMYNEDTGKHTYEQPSYHA